MHIKKYFTAIFISSAFLSAGLVKEALQNTQFSPIALRRHNFRRIWREFSIGEELIRA